MAAILRNRGEYDKALDNANLAMQQLSNIKYDSVKAAVYVELGNTYQAKSQSVLASTNYNTAFDIALKIKSVPLQSQIYHCFAEMYLALGNIDVAKEELMKSLTLDKEHNYSPGMVSDYYDLARVTGEKFYIDKSLEMAYAQHLYKYILGAKELLFDYYMVVEKNIDKTLHYLESESDLRESFMNVGMANYYKNIGHIYFYSKKADSALHYYKLAENDYLNNFDEKSSKNIFGQIAKTYQLLNDEPNAISYYTKVLALSKKMNDISSISWASDSLSTLYETQSNYKQSLIYSKQATEYQNSLRKLSEGRDIAILNVERENRKHAEELKQEEQRLHSKRNLQYMAITILIAVIFTIMLIVGMFPVSKLTIKMLGYFFFISLFEFIVLLIDNSFLAQLTHNEPLKLWGIKIALIAMLVPLQHALEHNLITFLESRKLLEARTNFSLKRWWQKIKKPASVTDTGVEEDTAVL